MENEHSEIQKRVVSMMGQMHNNPNMSMSDIFTVLALSEEALEAIAADDQAKTTLLMDKVQGILDK